MLPMRDPYLYEDAPVLKNLLNIKYAGMLVKAEAEGGKTIWNCNIYFTVALPLKATASP